MSYLRAYRTAIFEIVRMLGLIFLFASVVHGDALALFFVFVSLTAGVAGPIGLLISGGKDDK
jgi:hypothetical protein